MFLGIGSDGAALPCHNARELPKLEISNIKNHGIRHIWYHSQAFNVFRRYDWMQEPCRSRDEKEKNLGGCRCQAYLLTGDAAAADPVCSKSPKHQLVHDAIAAARTVQAKSGVKEHPIVFRTDKNSRELTNVTKVT